MRMCVYTLCGGTNLAEEYTVTWHMCEELGTSHSSIHHFRGLKAKVFLLDDVHEWLAGFLYKFKLRGK